MNITLESLKETIKNVKENYPPYCDGVMIKKGILDKIKNDLVRPEEYNIYGGISVIENDLVPQNIMILLNGSNIIGFYYLDTGETKYMKVTVSSIRKFKLEFNFEEQDTSNWRFRPLYGIKGKR